MKNIRYDGKKTPFNAHNCDNVNLNLNDINNFLLRKFLIRFLSLFVTTVSVFFTFILNYDKNIFFNFKQESLIEKL